MFTLKICFSQCNSLIYIHKGANKKYSRLILNNKNFYTANFSNFFGKDCVIKIVKNKNNVFNFLP